MRASISVILILFLFSSPSSNDQNAEEAKEEAVAPEMSDVEPTPTCDADLMEAQILSATSSLLGLDSIVDAITAGDALESFKDSSEGTFGGVEQLSPEDLSPVSAENIPASEAEVGTLEESVGVLSGVEVAETVEEEAKAKAEEERKESAVPPEVNKSEDSIPSFSEWTKLQLAQRKESIINNIKNKSSVLEGKNFAAPDCGAKIINSNTESQNPSGVISSSHDEYMLNRCTTNVWFIMELCEPLTIERLTLGNLELFSSNPHEFEVGVSDRYPTRDWIVFGPYHAPDSRNLHSFHLPPNNSTFGKYLRIVIKSHHGNEHYCPLSLIKVYGRSEYEVLESETTHAQDMDAEIPGIIEEEMNDDSPVENSVIGTATAVVMNMVKKAADVLVSKKVEEAVPKGKSEATEKVEPPSTCISLLQCLPDSEWKSSIVQFLTCRQTELTWLSQLLKWCGWAECQSLLESKSIGSPGTMEGFVTAIYGPSILQALCHFKYPLRICHKTPRQDPAQLTGAPNETAEGTGGQTLISPDKIISNEDEKDPIDAIRQPSPDATVPESVPPEIGQNFHLPTPPPPVEEPAQKESVFVRLSNRIKALERNQSLSSGYLEELSQRFKKQSEEMHSAHELFRKSLNDSLSKCTFLESTLRYEVRKLNRNLDTLRELIWRLELQRSGFFLLSLLQILSTLFLWWNRKGSKTQPYTYDGSVMRLEPLPPHQDQGSALLGINQRKRSCSIQPSSKQKKKKKRKEGGSVPEVKVLGNRIPTSLSTGSIPLRLPSQTGLQLSSPPQFEFKVPAQIQTNLNGGQPKFQLPPPKSQTPPLALLATPTHTPIKEGISSSSDLSESSSIKSQKKKSRLKSFFFGK